MIAYGDKTSGDFAIGEVIRQGATINESGLGRVEVARLEPDIQALANADLGESLEKQKW